MSFSLLSRQSLLRGQTTSALRAGGFSLNNSANVAAVPVARAIHTPRGQSSSFATKRWPIKTLGSGLVAAGGGWYLSTADSRTFTVYSPLESEAGASDEKQVTGSSTLLRPASPSAPRRQTVTLVFLTSQTSSKGLVKSLMSNFGGGSGEREKWFPWIGYFREAGYDCLQMNLALSPSEKSTADNTTARLADELHSQIRLSNLQRQPVLFVHHASDSSPEATSQIVSNYIEPGSGGNQGGGFMSKIFGGGMFGSRPAISGLVIISDFDDASAMELFGKHPKLNTLIVANGGAKAEANQGKVSVLDAQGKGHENVIKDIERWLIKEGYEG